ncbi:hypothetical protein Franean1_0371 [Parafrankia sp. EAN1pec]|uniref:hypothetical protein n=1 Tax=Parafrankia sp. (strain EAN1pec) TaxID=298653 RepID=UPI000054343D|nr:hypothetical protein Franean1_0371 [Frankia sp. EAN1pec]
MPSPGTDDLDAALRALEETVAAQAGVLLDLENSPERALLDPAPLSGVTRAEALAVIAVLADVWRAYAALRDVTEAARSLRGRRSRVDARTLTELTALLYGPSVPDILPQTKILPAPEIGPVPARHRPERAGQAHPEWVRPEQVRSGQVRPAELARRVDAAVAAVRGRMRLILGVRNALLAEIAAGGRAVAETSVLAARLGLAPGDAGLVAARRLLAELSAAARSDPLGVSPGLRARAEAAVAAATRSTGDLARRHDGLDADLAAAGALLAEITRLDDTARRDAGLATRRIRGLGPLYRLADNWRDDQQHGLAPWLIRLRAQAAAGRWKESSRGLARWLEVAEATHLAAQRIAGANGAALRRREELRGLLGAWEAKAARLGLTADPRLLPLARAARRELYSAPTDVERAAGLVNDFGAALAARGGSPAPDALPAPEVLPAPNVSPARLAPPRRPAQRDRSGTRTHPIPPPQTAPHPHPHPRPAPAASTTRPIQATPSAPPAPPAELARLAQPTPPGQSPSPVQSAPSARPRHPTQPTWPARRTRARRPAGSAGGGKPAGIGSSTRPEAVT